MGLGLWVIGDMRIRLRTEPTEEQLCKGPWS